MDIREKNRQLNESEYRDSATVLESLPPIVFLELTQNCNLACRMCRAPRPYDPAHNMPVELFDQALRDLGPTAGLIDLNGWGESTIRPDFPALLEKAIGTGARVRLVTNGHAMRPAFWSTLFRSNGVIIVSLDTTDARVYRALGRSDLSIPLAALKHGAETRHAEGRGILCINMTVSSVTLRDIPSVVSLAAELRLDRVLLNPIKCASDSPLDLSRVAGEIPAVLDRATDLAHKVGLEVRLGAALRTELAWPAALPSVCSNPWTNAIVDYRGRVGLCHHGIGWSEDTLIDRDFRSIWNGTAAVALRTALVSGSPRAVFERCPKCSWCSANRYGDPDFPAGEMLCREVSTRTVARLYNPASLTASAAVQPVVEV